jgi:urea transport system permease protein
MVPKPPPTPKEILARLEIFLIWACSITLIFFLPMLNSTGDLSDFTLNQWGKYLCYGILALSVDLLWGYTGLLSLGQALFFSLGGYMMGMHLMRMIGTLGQYKMPIPDFLVFLGWTELPTFWKPFDSFFFAMLMVVLLPAVIAFIFGFLAFRSRVKGVYFSILTQALTYAAALMFFRNDMLMGGNNGFTDFKFILGHNLRDQFTQRSLYMATAAVTVGMFLITRWLTKTKFGLVQRAIRDSETRVLFSGYAAANYKLFVFVLCSVIAAIGGALYVPQVGIINPSEMMTDKSLEAVVWCAVGGRGTLLGPIVGAVGVNALKSWTTSGPTTDYWPIILGVLFILVVLFMPKGVVGIPSMIGNGYRRLFPLADPAPAAPAEPEAPVEPLLPGANPKSVTTTEARA